jgi:GGDEF domain-containing protein
VDKERCAPAEPAARIGGDEFALCLCGDDVSEVVREVERIRRRFAEESDGATLSVGAAGAATVQRSPGSLSLLEAAGDALLDAKNERPAGLKIFRPFSY